MTSKPRAAWLAGITLILLVGFPALQAPEAIAPSHPTIEPAPLEGGVKGTVRSSAGGTLGGALVRAVASDGSEPASALTEPDGRYALGLAPGTYTLGFSARAHRELNMTVVVSGTVASAQDAVLNATGPVLRGTVRDAASARGLGNVTVEAHQGSGCPPGAACIAEERALIYRIPLSTRSGPDGRYALAVEAGAVDLRAWRDGYRDAFLSLDVQRDTTQDLRLEALPPKTAVLEGVVRDAVTGQPIEGAWVSAWPQHDAKPLPADDAGDATVVTDCVDEDGDFVACPDTPSRSCCAEGNSTQSGKDGRFRMDMYPGRYMLNVGADRYGGHQREVELPANRTTTADVDLEPIPPDSVLVRGEVRDAKTGEAVQGAWVSLENQKWGHYNGTSTDAAGRFELRTKPGWTLVWVRLDGGGYAVPVASGAGAGGGQAASGNTSSPQATPEEDIRAPEPSPPPGRGGSYYPWVRGQDLAEGQRLELDVALEPKPQADVRIVGYVVNATAKKAIAGAQVNVRNEDTGDWGYATTHEDGSFVILGRAGTHTVSAWADGYYNNAVIVKVEGPETRVDLHLQPGRQQGYCCIAYAEGARADAASGPPAPMAPMPGADAEAREGTAAGVQGQGPASYQASGEKLGAYDPATAPESGEAQRPDEPRLTPGPAALLVAMVLVGAAALARRRR